MSNSVPLAGPIHASSVMVDGRVVLIAGRSGSGKSDLALRLIDRGALLVADDYTRVEGIVELASAVEGSVALLVDLDRAVERMPAEPLPTTALDGIAIPTLGLSAFEASAPIKVEQALRRHGLGGPQ